MTRFTQNARSPLHRCSAHTVCRRGKRGHHENHDGTLICADVIEGLNTVQDHSINLGLTSPPYAQQRSGYYTGVSEEQYPAWMVEVMRALRPKLTSDASVLIVIRSHIRNGCVSDYVLRTRLAL